MRQAANKPASRRKSKPAPAYIPPVALSAVDEPPEGCKEAKELHPGKIVRWRHADTYQA